MIVTQQGEKVVQLSNELVENITINSAVKFNVLPDIALATSSSPGLMSAADKTKLDTFQSGSGSGTGVSYDIATNTADGLMSSQDKAKLNLISEGAEVNAINKISVNGISVAISNKTVNIDLSSYALKDGDKILSTNDFTDDYKNKLDNLNNFTLPLASTDSIGGVQLKAGDPIKVDNGLLTVDINNLATALKNSNFVPSSLPAATATTKGAIIPGTGLRMDGDTLNVTMESGGAVSSDYELPTASETQKGGIKIGNGLSINNDVLSVTLEAPSYNDVTTVNSGLMTAQDKIKLNSLENYVLPTANKTQKGGIIPGNGVLMDGDTLNVTVNGGGTVLEGTMVCLGDISTLEDEELGRVFRNSANDNVYIVFGKDDYVKINTPDIATTTKDGLISAQDKKKLDDIEDKANLYVLPTAHASVKGGIRPGTGLEMTGEVMAVRKFNIGEAGAVPAPSTASDELFLCSNGTWVTLQQSSANVQNIGLIGTVASTIEGSMWLA